MKSFRTIGFLEGASFLLLLFIAMPLKYSWGYPLAVRVVGMAHGGLFVAYVFLAFEAASDFGWSRKKLGLSLLASLLPFGTFVFDRKYLRDEAKVGA